MSWDSAHSLLPLAEGVLGERGGCLPAESAAQPFRRAGADRLPGEEDPDQRRGPGRTDGGARRAKKNAWGPLAGAWVPHDTRDRIVDFVRRWSEKTEIRAGRFIGWLDIAASKFYDWRDRYGTVNEHNVWVPRDFWLEDWEKQAIIGFHLRNPLEGYRRLTFMMLYARHCGSESVQRLASARTSGTVVEVEQEAVEEGHGLRATAGGAPTLARRCFVHQHQRDVLLPVQHSGRL